MVRAVIGRRSAWRPTLSAPLVACALQALCVASAVAHRSTPSGSTAGLPIPSVSHGQMQVLKAYRGDILSLADERYPTDPDMRRLESFVNLQYFYCAWGLVPGGVSDEGSPFNECTHAYLAGVRALLLHLEAMPGDGSAVRALRRRIDTDMLRNHASLVLCRFSEEPFNTADVVAPRWTEVLSYGPSLAVLVTLAFGAALIGALAATGMVKPPNSAPSCRSAARASSGRWWRRWRALA